MKQNMCVTIDQGVHEWLKSKPEMMSRLVNGILARAMVKETMDKLAREGVIESMRPRDRYCPHCDTTQTGIKDHCTTPSCALRFGKIEVIE